MVEDSAKIQACEKIDVDSNSPALKYMYFLQLDTGLYIQLENTLTQKTKRQCRDLTSYATSKTPRHYAKALKGLHEYRARRHANKTVCTLLASTLEWSLRSSIPMNRMDCCLVSRKEVFGSGRN